MIGLSKAGRRVALCAAVLGLKRVLHALALFFTVIAAGSFFAVIAMGAAQGMMGVIVPDAAGCFVIAVLAAVVSLPFWLLDEGLAYVARRVACAMKAG